VVGRTNGIKDGGSITIRIPIGLCKLRWISQYSDYVEGKQFADVMLKGPFKSWKHIHPFNLSEEEKSDLPSVIQRSYRIFTTIWIIVEWKNNQTDY
jgi:ligand-binding SRPBCC domain-containing protein